MISALLFLAGMMAGAFIILCCEFWLLSKAARMARRFL